MLQKNGKAIRESVDMKQINKNLNKINSKNFFKTNKKKPVEILKKKYRRSKIEKANKSKQIIMKKLGNKFNLIFSTVKKFILERGIEKIKTDIKISQEKLVDELDSSSDLGLKKTIKKKYLIGLMKVIIFEIKSLN